MKRNQSSSVTVKYFNSGQQKTQCSVHGAPDKRVVMKTFVANTKLDSQSASIMRFPSVSASQGHRTQQGAPLCKTRKDVQE